MQNDRYRNDFSWFIEWVDSLAVSVSVILHVFCSILDGFSQLFLHWMQINLLYLTVLFDLLVGASSLTPTLPHPNHQQVEQLIGGFSSPPPVLACPNHHPCLPLSQPPPPVIAHLNHHHHPCPPSPLPSLVPTTNKLNDLLVVFFHPPSPPLALTITSGPLPPALVFKTTNESLWLVSGSLLPTLALQPLYNHHPPGPPSSQPAS